ncbi:DUF6364 family protein [Mucilaginibacter roseus]|uniref:DUF6364 family protein n=1 Tax=Mucilaginibacter roseus TaxID=1528868 RepID=A0ABS8U2X3_9SPHI|nr:DUF6364 family protein [Mucilaginibacter roseus]MCD8741456.1 DUF6364 family protein [Mucilaginibacter roseus]
MAKLTLSIEPDVIENAKRYARGKHKSLSALVQDYLKKISDDNGKEDELLKRLNLMIIPDDLQALTGILKGKYPDDVNYKDIKGDYLKEKYGL